ncbi:PhzF family phenazine biosynthesis protein [Nesterenkonia sandarakina]|uniref:PhzF family phenazine biosynthesis protein n=1 Tax=Nesterenkonia sandarakina TaxID=272918 RepID=A0A7Z0E6W1_9MICC|nr:PhzF family phenazine biosynthesis isomerase [Nesterenkonia sandarakina]NYJ16185.1 PhzF family phenazine biosynthesis protein [Nesterenkonia sandarakina]
MDEILHYTAFTSDPSGGNPAGVVLDAQNLSDEERQDLASQIGYSETAFLESGPIAGTYRVRFFSPLAEVAFCGHATIATAVALAHRSGVADVVFETLAGPIPVSTQAVDGVVRATLTSTETWSRPASAWQIQYVLDALGWSAEDLSTEFPPHEAFGGETHLVLVTASRRRLTDVEYDFDALKAIMQDYRWTTVQLVWFENEHLAHSRNLFPVGGVVEDPATGAAAAALGGYLRSLGRVHGRCELTILQGEDMGRPSRLDVVAHADSKRVTVAGSAVPITH